MSSCFVLNHPLFIPKPCFPLCVMSILEPFVQLWHRKTACQSEVGLLIEGGVQAADLGQAFHHPLQLHPAGLGPNSAISDFGQVLRLELVFSSLVPSLEAAAILVSNHCGFKSHLLSISYKLVVIAHVLLCLSNFLWCVGFTI